MRRVTTVPFLCAVIAVGCSGATARRPGADAGAEDTGGAAGANPSRPDARATGAAGNEGGGDDGGGAKVDSGGGAPDAAAAIETEAGALDASPPAAGQGPAAEGKLVFSQDFEAGMDGITRSPTNLPEDRAQVVDDPLGQRGKVMRIVYQQGDNFMTNGGSTHTRSFISNTGYSFPVGSTIHYAWGFLTTSPRIDAAFAQHIRPGGPMWLMEGNGDGTIYVNCRSCGGKADLPVKLEPNRWYDIRVELTYANGGPIRFFIDGRLVLERKMTINDPAGQRAHWDGGIYNHAAGTYTRTVYISNLSVGLK